MPTILRQAGFRVMIYVADHPPAHVHVKKAGGELIVNLGDEETAPSIRANNSMAKSDERQAVRIVEDNQDGFLIAWRELHG